MPQAAFPSAFPSAFQVHKFWLIRISLILVLTTLLDGIVVWFSPHPLLWAGLIPGTLPFTMLFFVALPLLKQEKTNPQSNSNPT